MANLAVIGGQWGDEGKGKIVDLLAPRFAIVARYQGGPNAGHTVVFNGQTHALHHIPSGIFHAGVRSVIGPGALIDPESLNEELEGLTRAGVPYAERLTISERAHVILPLHRVLDAAIERRLGDDAIGTTRRGIGPAYAARAHRWGLRLVELGDADAVATSVERVLRTGIGDLLEEAGEPAPTGENVVDWAAHWWNRLEPLCGDVSGLLQDASDRGEPILFEGAQGTLLDIDHGTYPFVTSSSTTAGGIPAGVGLPPRSVDRVLGVMKAYQTRVGAGPFPTEDEGPLGERLRRVGHEFGTTTGRPRRCGWFDAVAARYAVRLNGIDALAVTKFDVLSGVDPLRIAVGYVIDGERVDRPPAAASAMARALPVFEELAGWNEPIGELRRLEDLPRTARAYLDRMAELSGCPIGVVSVGADRRCTIIVEGGLLERFDAHA
ncbi:MAG: adenylosuccinate synthase [Acidobacteriota bacterium]|nr:MAG: adenylosuccinate synthase [Acidobacteriota bacterium]